MSEQRVMWVFPGQGSQYRGMGSDLCSEYPVARETYAEASDALGYDIARLSFEDPANEIGLTRYTQPALLTHSMACLRVWRELAGDVAPAACAAGHSLGEYSALVAAGSLGLADGLRLVKRRGELMGEFGEGGMLALGVDVTEARRIADQHYCQVASINLPEQTVVGGRDADLASLAAAIEQSGSRKRAIRLATEGAFHTYLMVEAARRFRETLDATAFQPPAISVLSNYTATAHDADAGAIRTRLFFQLFSPVNWVGCLRAAIDGGITHMIEFGGGIGTGDKRPNLESIVRKTLKGSSYEAKYAAAINVATIRAAAAGRD